MTRLGDYLQGAQLDRLDADALAAHALGVARSYLYSHPEHHLAPAEHDRLAELVRERARGVPVAYLTGHQEFWSLDLQVDPRVLIPRPETEMLVELTLDEVELTLDYVNGSAQVLELGTGSGAIALALASERPGWTITATDRDPDALALARANADQLGLAPTLLQTDWYSGVDGAFHVIVSNPPYIAADDPHLAALDHEPLGALASGPDGLDDLRKIIAGAPAHLCPNGCLLVEHGWDQAAAVRDLFAAAGFTNMRCHQDLAGHDRVTLGHYREQP